MILLKNFLNLPTPSSINYVWNFGSLLGLSLAIQIFTGVFLSFHYEASSDQAFDKVLTFCNEVEYGWLIRFLHSSGASVFFIMCYCHIGKALVYQSYFLIKVWASGLLIFFTLMGSAFLGYVLPWGQMSFWGATVITNLISVIPYVGESVVSWLWGGFNVNSATLNRFFSFHFILPFLVSGLVMTHIIFLHESGSSNPVGVSMNLDKISFFNYFVIKDLVTVVLILTILMVFSVHFPFTLMDHENFIEANPMLTPPHIQPEWYFLFAYAILRSIPNKLGGVVFLVFSIGIILILPFLSSYKVKGSRFQPLKSLLFWFHTGTVIILTWLGSMPVEAPFVSLGKLYTVVYFIFYFIYP